MNDFTRVRLTVYLTALVLCGLAERLLPRRVRVAPAAPRWLLNLGLAALGAVFVRLLPLAAVEAAGYAESARFGLLNLLPLPAALRFALSLALLDFLIYWQHRLFHLLPLLWRLHAVHHADLDLDASSGVRFHPGEILISAALKLAAAAALGADPSAVLLFELILLASSIFNHANIALGPLDASLRLLLVTPDVHRVHHSPIPDEMNSNFGFAIPWWDRLFGTYRAQPRAPHATMALGLPA